jgi:hypothetical protein
VRKIFHSVVAAGKDAVHVVFIVGGGFVPQDMMICVVLGRIQVFRLGLFVKNAMICSVVRAVFLAALFAKSAEFT